MFLRYDAADLSFSTDQLAGLVELLDGATHDDPKVRRAIASIRQAHKGLTVEPRELALERLDGAIADAQELKSYLSGKLRYSMRACLASLVEQGGSERGSHSRRDLSNYDADDAVRAAVAEADPQLAARVVFDTESGEFGVYAATAEDMAAVTAIVRTTVERAIDRYAARDTAAVF